MEKLPLKRRRILALEMFSEGATASEVSGKTGLSLPTAYKYKTLLDSGDRDAIVKLQLPGGKPRLDEKAQSWLISAIKHSPKLHGYETRVWTVAAIRQVIEQRFGIRYSITYVARFVRDHGLGNRLTYASEIQPASWAALGGQPGVDAARRKSAAIMLCNGESEQVVADSLNIGLRTVKAYSSLIRSDGPDALEQLRPIGRMPTLGRAALGWLRTALQGSPLSHGFESDLWRNSDVQTLIRDRFGAYHSNGYVRKVVGKLGLLHRMHAPKLRTEKKRITFNDDALAWIASTVRQSPRNYGFDGDHWNNARLRAVVQQRFGVEYSRSYIRQLAHKAGVAELLTKRRN